MKLLTLAALPYVVAFVVPAATLALLYGAQGSNSAYGLFGGAIALIGALLAKAVQLALRRRREEAELNATVAWLQSQTRHE